MERHLQIRAALDDVRDACDFVVEAAQDCGLDDRAAYHCEMAVDEICTNVAEHGYQNLDERSQGIIDIKASVHDDCFTVTISDNSPAFDPTIHDDPDIQSDAVKMQPGGWGIYFVKQLMDKVEYTYSEGRNQLILTKCLPATVERAKVHGMELSVDIFEVEKNYWSVKLGGRIDTLSAPTLSTQLTELVESGRAHLVMDFSGIDYVSSSGLKVVAAIWRDTRDQNGTLLITGLQPRIYEIFDVVGFTSFIDVYPDLEAALSSAG